VPRRDDRPLGQPGLPRRPERGDRRGEQRRLRIRGAVELLLRPVPAERRQIEAERLIRFVERKPRELIVFRERLPHPDDLRALAREEPGDAV